MKIDADVTAVIEFFFVWSLIAGGAYVILALLSGWWPFA